MAIKNKQNKTPKPTVEHIQTEGKQSKVELSVGIYSEDGNYINDSEEKP